MLKRVFAFYESKVLKRAETAAENKIQLDLRNERAIYRAISLIYP